jgi:hypothetical protein
MECTIGRRNRTRASAPLSLIRPEDAWRYTCRAAYARMRVIWVVERKHGLAAPTAPDRRRHPSGGGKECRSEWTRRPPFAAASAGGDPPLNGPDPSRRRGSGTPRCDPLPTPRHRLSASRPPERLAGSCHRNTLLAALPRTWPGRSGGPVCSRARQLASRSPLSRTARYARSRSAVNSPGSASASAWPKRASISSRRK